MKCRRESIRVPYEASIWHSQGFGPGEESGGHIATSCAMTWVMAANSVDGRANHMTWKSTKRMETVIYSDLRDTEHLKLYEPSFGRRPMKIKSGTCQSVQRRGSGGIKKGILPFMDAVWTGTGFSSACKEAQGWKQRWEEEEEGVYWQAAK